MKQSKKLRNVFVILFVSLLSSCARIPVKDSEWCGDLGSEGASCFNTLSDNQRDIPKDKWDEERVGMICTKSQTFADWQATILKLCKASKRCTFEDKKIIINFMENVKHIESITEEK
jgi:hypothetical protein